MEVCKFGAKKQARGDSFSLTKTPAGKDARHRYVSTEKASSSSDLCVRQKALRETSNCGALVHGGCESEFCAQQPQIFKEKKKIQYTCYIIKETTFWPHLLVLGY
jgi:hypothetical protein